MAAARAKLAAGKTVKWKDEQFPSVYANIMGIGLSPFDINIVFGEVGESTDTEVLCTPRVKILLVPEQAANLMKLVSVALEAYTKNNGQLRTSGAVDVDALNIQVDSQKRVQ